MVRDSRRYLGIELAGAKNQKTALAILEHYPKERKIFLLDLYEKISGNKEKTGDEALLELIQDMSDGVSRTGVNVPLELPPCIECTRKTCPMPARCSVPSVKWMKLMTRKAKGLEFTPYTQRPVELWVRYEIFPKLPEWARYEIDETLGGNKAPLTARMHFLKRQLGKLPIEEVSPKLSTSLLGLALGLSKRTISTYRHLEQGAHAREEILEALVAQRGIFIYERDLQRLALSLSAFDAFICAYTALLSDQEKCARPPQGFPIATGWLQFPHQIDGEE